MIAMISSESMGIVWIDGNNMYNYNNNNDVHLFQIGLTRRCSFEENHASTIGKSLANQINLLPSVKLWTQRWSCQSSWLQTHVTSFKLECSISYKRHSKTQLSLVTLCVGTRCDTFGYEPLHFGGNSTCQLVILSQGCLEYAGCSSDPVTNRIRAKLGVSPRSSVGGIGKKACTPFFKSSMILRACAIHLAYSYQTNESTRTFWNLLRLWTKYEVTQQSIALPLMTLPSPLRQDWSALSIPRFTCTSQCLIWTGFDGTAWDMIFSALKSEKWWLHCTLHISALCLASKSMASTGSTFW